jgi:hypothetical protein
MKTEKDIRKALINCEKVRRSNKPKKKLCPLFPGEPICLDCTFPSTIEWLLENRGPFDTWVSQQVTYIARKTVIGRKSGL